MQEPLSKNNIALKEWAAVCSALRDGVQIALLRKGGLRDAAGTFDTPHSEFFLLPGYEHQDSALLKPEFAGAQPYARATDPHTCQIDTYAIVHRTLPVRSDATLTQLEPFWIWNRAYIDVRLNFNPYDPLYVLILRAYRLTVPVILTMRTQYGGCKSWVTLNREIATEGIAPAIDEVTFLQRSAVLEQILAPSALATVTD